MAHHVPPHISCSSFWPVLIPRNIQEIKANLAIDNSGSANEVFPCAPLSNAGLTPSNVHLTYSPIPAQASSDMSSWSSDKEAQVFEQRAPTPEPACLVTHWADEEDLLEPARRFSTPSSPDNQHDHIGPLKTNDEPEPSQEPL